MGASALLYRLWAVGVIRNDGSRDLRIVRDRGGEPTTASTGLAVIELATMFGTSSPTSF